MEKSANSNNQSPGQVQPEVPEQLPGLAPSKMLNALRRALLGSKRENEALAAEMAALKEQLAKRENGWEEERKQLMDERDILMSTLRTTQNNMKDLVEDLESVKAREKKLQAQQGIVGKVFKQTQERVFLLEEELAKAKTEAEKSQAQFLAISHQYSETKFSFNNHVAQVNSAWKSQMDDVVCKAAAQLNALQSSCDKMVDNIIKEKDRMITSARTETMALVDQNLEHLAKLQTVEAKMHQKEEDWQRKVDALEDTLRCERLEREQLEMTTRLAKEEEWTKRVSIVEEEIHRLIQENNQLKQLAYMSDKDKAKMQKVEQKARKEAERRLKKEIKEEKKQEKKEREEREKREKKERKEKEQQEKKEKAETKKKEKKERKEKSKEEKKEKQERKKREKKEKKDQEKQTGGNEE